MGKALNRGFLTIVFFGALFLTGDLASAAPELQAGSVAGTSSGIFSNPQPGSAVVSGVGTDFFTWGTGLSGSPPSSLSFDGTTFAADFDELFTFGTLTYFNGTIVGGTGADEVDLVVTILLTMPSGVTGEITQTLTLINTPNVGTPEENADRILLPTVPDPPTFTVDGVEHAFILEGFGSISGAGSATTIDEFLVLEEETASVELLGRITKCGDPGFHLGAVPVQGGFRTLCWKANVSKGIGGLGDILNFQLTLVNPNPEDIAVVVCAMANTVFFDVVHPEWEASVVEGTWTGELVDERAEPPSFHFACRQFLKIPGGGKEFWFDQGELSFQLVTRPYIDFLFDLPVGGKLDFRCRPLGPPSCVRGRNQYLVPDELLGTELYANWWADLVDLSPSSPALGGTLEWPVGNWVTMRDPDTYLARLNGTVIDAPTGSVLTFSFPPGTPELERTFVVPPSNPDNPTCLGLPVEVSEPFVIPPEQARMTLDVQVTEECSALREGSVIRFLGEAVGEPGSPIFQPGEFIVGLAGTLVVDNTPPQVDELIAVPVGGGLLDVQASSTDAITMPLAALLGFRIDGGSEEQTPMGYDEPPSDGVSVFFRQTIGPFPPGSTIEITAEVFDDVGNSATSPPVEVIVPPVFDIQNAKTKCGKDGADQIRIGGTVEGFDPSADLTIEIEADPPIFGPVTVTIPSGSRGPVAIPGGKLKAAFPDGGTGEFQINVDAIGLNDCTGDETSAEMTLSLNSVSDTITLQRETDSKFRSEKK